LLLLDVDGPLFPYDATDELRAARGYRPYPEDVWLNPEHGPRLLRLAARTGWTLVWCTTWEGEANTWIGPPLGLPELPVIHFRGIRAWKFAAVAEYAAGRPLAWFDDDFHLFPEALAVFEKSRAGLATLLHHVSPATGLREADFTAVEEWVAGRP
jgi:hypothetical protein